MKKLILFLFFSGLLAVGYGQTFTWQSSKVKQALRGDMKERTLDSPITIKADYGKNIFTVETADPTLQKMLKEKSSWKISKKLGTVSKQYSIRLADEHTFVHYHLEPGFIIMTRDDIHPLQWGITFLEIQEK